MSTSPEPVGAPSTLSVDFGEKRRKLLTSVIKHGIAGMATIAKENGIVSEGTGDRNKNGARDTDKARKQVFSMLKAFGIRKEWVQVPKGVKPEVTTPAGIKRESVIPMTPKSSPLLAPSKRKAGKYSSDDDEDDNTDLFFLELSPRKKFKYVKIQEDSEMEIGE